MDVTTSPFRTRLVLALCLALLAPAAAADHLRTKDGQTLSGRATKYDAERKVLSFRADDGRQLDFALDQLDQRSVYQVNASLIAKDNGKGQLQLANFARDIRTYVPL